MANPGLGFRTVNSLLIEISLHFLQPYVNTQITQAIVAPGPQTVSIASTDMLYPGARVVVDTGLITQEEITVTDVGIGTITAVFANTHSINAAVLGGTFPIQQPTDPFFTQAEVLSYIARAQNEFLARVPAIFELLQQTIAFGQILQSTPCETIEMNRVAVSTVAIALSSLTRTGNVVSAVSVNPQGLVVNQKFSIISAADSSFLGAFKTSTVLDSTHFTYPQVAGNAGPVTATAGLWNRLYELSQEELTMQNRTWQTQFTPQLRSWFEDRSGIYRWGVGGKPSSNFPAEILLSIRDTDTLDLTDGFLIPDLVLHFPKYLAASWMWDKDGEQRNPKMAKYCRMRFDRGVMATQRWLDGLVGALPSSTTRRRGGTG